jgi:antibiotic biosynthesis monooxygenase (ABM) superfamily enzyme
MFGTMFKAKLKPGKAEAMKQLGEEEMATRDTIPGLKAAYVLSEGDEMWGLVIFENEETYRANSESAEQDRWFRRRLELMEGPPEWHDGPIRVEMPQ